MEYFEDGGDQELVSIAAQESLRPSEPLLR